MSRTIYVIRRGGMYQTRVRLLHHLAVGTMEDGVVDVVERESSKGGRPIAIAVQASLLCLSVFPAVSGVCSVDSGNVGSDGEGAVDLGVLGIELGLVEVVGVSHVRPMYR